MSSKIRVFACALLVAGVAVAGCGDNEDGFGTGIGLGKGTEGDVDESKSASGDTEAATAEVDSGPIVYTDEDFAELDIQNRDPFRSYAKAFQAQSAAPAQRRVLLPSTSGRTCDPSR